MTEIAIIETGTVPPDLRAQHGTYPAMLEAAIGSAAPAIRFRTVSVVTGEALPPLEGVDAAIITGSAHSVYEDLPWRNGLEQWIRVAHRQTMPLVGICFGHQLIAQALGGVVERSSRGWGLGRHVYEVVPPCDWLGLSQVAIACSHQDQVVVAPPNARVVLRSEFTPYAGLLYKGDRILTLQAHPEFNAAYAETRIRARVKDTSFNARLCALASLKERLDNAAVIGAISRLLLLGSAA